MMKTLTKTLALVGGALTSYHVIMRPKMLKRGATAEEVDSVLPGDEITPPNPFRSTMATTLEATPAEIWPWLVQVGWQRGAFYSYNKIEGLLGMDLKNANRIHQEWQGLKVGDVMWMSHPRLKYLFPVTKALTIDPFKTLVFAIYGPEGPNSTPSGAWSFILEPIDDHTTRLIARFQVSTPSFVGKMLFYGFMEPAHFLMQKGMFKGLKERLAHNKGEPSEKNKTPEPSLN
jgi:hypothetical protein